MPDFAHASTPDAIVPARLHGSGFALSDSNFYSMSLISDGKVYYTLSSHDIDTHGRVYRFDPAADRLDMLFDLGEATGEAGGRTLPQGKSHSPFYEVDGTLYLATHYGFFAMKDQKEQLAELPEGYEPYVGGHILAYDMASGQVKDLATAPPAEGIITFNVDPERGRMYGLTWPGGRFLVYDMERGTLEDRGPVSRGGEGGSGEEYFCLCRAFAIDPRDGAVYMTNPDGQVLRHRPGEQTMQPVEGLSLRRDILGCWDPHKPGHQGFNWRDISWHAEEQVFYGVHPKSGWLFRFDPPAERIELIERIVAEPLQRSGRWEPFRYGYLTLRIGPDRRTLYYLTGVYDLVGDDGREVPTGMHLVTYNLDMQQRTDHGVLRLDDGRYPVQCQTLAVHPSGRLFSCPWIEKPGRAEDDPVKNQCDLISFADPLAGGAS